MNDTPVFITYRDRREMLDQTLRSLVERDFTNITVIDNDSAEPLYTNQDIPDGGRVLVNSDIWGGAVKVVRTDNAHRHLTPWLADLVPDDRDYIVMDCDNELVCPCVGSDCDVCNVLRDILVRHPELPKVGLGIKTDDLLFPPPDHYAYSYLMEYSVERGTRYKTIDRAWTDVGGDYTVIDAPIDTTFAMYRAGSGWPGIVGARTTAPYHIRHLSWYNREYTAEERLYYERAGTAWTMGHSAESLLELQVVVPFTELRWETVVALHDQKQINYAPLRYDEGYFELLRDYWAKGRSFCVVEHDIVVHETTIDELRLCENDWCAMPFPYRGVTYAYSLACTKFSSRLIQRHPDLFEEVAQFHDEKHPPRHWCRLDAWIFQVLIRNGELRCEHYRAEPVGHIGGQYPKHGCLEIGAVTIPRELHDQAHDAR